MSILVTMMKNSMIGKPGYIVTEVLENIYTFDKCLKLQIPEIELQKIDKWICYLEGTNNAFEFDVKCKRLINGYTQACIYNFKMLTVDEIGEYKPSSNQNYYIAEKYNGKVLRYKELLQEVQKDFINKNLNSTEQNIRPVTPKPKVQKKMKVNMNQMTAERILELKRQIFGSSYKE